VVVVKTPAVIRSSQEVVIFVRLPVAICGQRYDTTVCLFLYFRLVATTTNRLVFGDAIWLFLNEIILVFLLRYTRCLF